jgi:aromatic ring-opening dioxygenase catalytic subunit (LigB family)
MPTSQRMPAVYLPHGGGPWPWMDEGFFRGLGDYEGLRAYLSTLANLPPAPPRAILAVTAHWEQPVATVSSAPAPGMLYDYSGFPPNTYQIRWPAPGDPALAARVRELLGAAGFQTAEDAARGYDHGTFVPLAVAYPEAAIPTVQLSLVAGLDPQTHLDLGRALAPLRDEGVFIVGSGMSFHNMRAFGTAAGAAAAEAFDAWLRATVSGDAAARDLALARWIDAPAARASHPREEHLLPLMVVAGAAGLDVGSVPFSENVLGTRVSAVHFGA